MANRHPLRPIGMGGISALHRRWHNRHRQQSRRTRFSIFSRVIFFSTCPLLLRSWIAFLGLSRFVWCHYSVEGSNRTRSSSAPARPYIERLSAFSLLICPSVCPLLQFADGILYNVDVPAKNLNKATDRVEA